MKHRLREKFRKLRTQIALHYLIASLLVLVPMAVILYLSMSAIVLGEAKSNMKTDVNKSGMYIDLYIDRLAAVSRLLAEDPQLERYYSGQDRPQSLKRDIRKTIDTTLASDRFIKSVVMVSKDGEVISNEKGLIMSRSANMMSENWYRKAIAKGGKPFLTSARMQNFTMDQDAWVISISREIQNAKGDNIGVLLIDLDYQVIEDYLSNLNLGANGFSFILNRQSEVVYHKNPDYFQNKRKQQELKAIVADRMGYDKKENTLTYTYHLKNADWQLVSVSSQDSLLAVKRQLIEIFVWVGLALLALSVISVWLFARRITAPFQRLEQAMQAVQTGLAQVVVDEKGSYEAESLARHFNSMMQRIDGLMQEIRKNEKHLRKAEINVLHSQINPHFLYNTLDTIIWMAEFGDHEKVIDLTKALAAFFRLSLSGGSEWTTIENELDHVRQYLFIQKERYGDKLQYEIHCEDDLREVEIPKLILQPLVENALYHGIRQLPGGGMIKVRASRRENAIVLTVEDNGPGFDVDALEQKRVHGGARLGGVGIANVDERVRLYYGEGFGVRIESGDWGTVVKVRVAGG